MGLSPKFDSKP